MRTWLARLLIGIVIVWNLQAAFVFFTWPGSFTPGFELSGVPGEAALRGIAILFVMWNVPYALAIWNPVSHRLSLKEAIVMQAIGLLGESYIYLGLTMADANLQSSILRFVGFDATGLFLLLVAWSLVRKLEV